MRKIIHKSTMLNHSFIPRYMISKSMLSLNFEIFYWYPFLSKSLNFRVTKLCVLKQYNINYICGKNQDLERISKFLGSKNITVPFLLWHPVVLQGVNVLDNGCKMIHSSTSDTARKVYHIFSKINAMIAFLRN